MVEGGFELAVQPVDTAVADSPAAPAELLGNYPNPFNPATKIAFSLAADGQVSLDVISPDGRLVATLLHGHRGAGRHEVEWLGLDDAGRLAPFGVYLARLRAAGHTETRSLVLLK